MTTVQKDCFLAAAETLNFTAASERIYMTQPALSRNISALEEELGVDLFLRKNNVISLTPGGEVVYRWLKQSQTIYNNTLLEAKLANRVIANELKVAFIFSENPFADDVAVMRRFVLDREDVNLQVSHRTACDMVDGLLNHSIDIGIMAETAIKDDSRFVVRKIRAVRKVLAVSILHPFSALDSISLKDAKDECFISLSSKRSPTMTPRLLSACKREGFVPRVMEVGSMFDQIDLLESNKGVALLLENHFCNTNPLVKFIPIQAEYSVNLVYAYDADNPNPCIAEFTRYYES